jgi:hypothetical protein
MDESARNYPTKRSQKPGHHEHRCIEDLNAIGESLVELPEPNPKKKEISSRYNISQ